MKGISRPLTYHSCVVIVLFSSCSGFFIGPVHVHVTGQNIFFFKTALKTMHYIKHKDKVQPENVHRGTTQVVASLKTKHFSENSYLL